MAPRKTSSSETSQRTHKSAEDVTEKGLHVQKGKCRNDTCGLEAACKPLFNDTYTCICPHLSTPPNKDLKCVRKTVPITPSPIHYIIPPTLANSTTTTSTAVDPTITSPFGNNTIAIAGAASLVFVFICTICSTLCCVKNQRKSICTSIKDKKRKPQSNDTPVSLTKGLLDADRYTTNPQYFVPTTEVPLSLISVPTIPREQIHFVQVIGEGCFGKVFKGELQNDFGETETVAIKVLKESATKEAEQDFMREVEIMSSFQHSHILTLLGVALKEPGKSPWMVFEFMPYGDLTEVLRNNSERLRKPDSPLPILTKESLLSIALQIACGMEYLAGQHFVHRDLACRNCLVGENLTVKIADFGMSRDVYTCDYYKIGGSRLLPVRWMSPESVTYGRFTLESDVWSYGVVLWEIYSLGKQPYFGHSNEEVVKLILQGIMLIPPEDCPPGICELMESCWKTEPRDRATFPEINQRLLRVQAAAPLPRPPPFPVGLNTQLAMDSEDYLKPMPPKPPHEYIQPLPD